MSDDAQGGSDTPQTPRQPIPKSGRSDTEKFHKRIIPKRIALHCDFWKQHCSNAIVEMFV
jgi:hypothetical protein